MLIVIQQTDHKKYANLKHRSCFRLAYFFNLLNIEHDANLLCVSAP